ncbi:nucleotidyl transferase AbiEii/AbiGii toxin family protein [Helicobacter macacae]|uniref:Nucleotidyl transferase AbiEii/AbiGii toxin family protein n=1 Tax=Helicobacter macacae MIT 99-5501 TaxID=1357400 RepID=V8CB26_9HELI|nr:nucleotidyl transferase AbiEii/AbiGii toxin family protein [Helicobacter macacae]ETD24220.1 hypothetical protein HMPREF2086_00970 [Helicobacter macacae MIT 99-5501]
MPYQLNLTQSNVDFIKTYCTEQIYALEQFLPIVNESVNRGAIKDGIAFGGGTALTMYYLAHRRSFDIDLFVDDRQYLSFFSPKLWILENSKFNDSYTELAHHIGFSTKENIKIDILASPFIEKALLDDSKSFFSQSVYIHSIEDIIANKIRFRKLDNKTRDIFDIVASIQKYPNLIDDLLEKESINKNDIKDLKTAIQTLNYEKYHNDIEMMQPIQEYKEIALNAPKILIDYIDTHILKTTTIPLQTPSKKPNPLA